jgi:very-short-patch-repair endonuclease
MRRKIIPYDHNLKQLARNLRNNSTLAEVLLWRELKCKQIRGYDFHRQKPIDKYIVDFYCPDLLLAIEIDGVSHDEKITQDENRQQKLECLGVRFLRFTDREVKTNLQGVVMAIEDWIDAHRPTPNPSKGGELKVPSREGI